jgi:hypothetical protein
MIEWFDITLGRNPSTRRADYGCEATVLLFGFPLVRDDPGAAPGLHSRA